MTHIKAWLNSHYDYVVGYISANIIGFKLADSFFLSAIHFMGVLILSILTGAGGAFGAHLVKKLIEKYNGRQIKPKQIQL